MSVYFIRSGGLIKIGYSNDVRQRVAAIIRTLREGGEYIGFTAGDRKVEQYYHRRFAGSRVYSEWFTVSDQLLALIEAVATPGYPDEEKTEPQDRLRQQEERYADEAAYFIRSFVETRSASVEAFDKLGHLTTISPARLKSIYDGEACPITAGEYVLMRMVHDAAGASDTDRGKQLDMALGIKSPVRRPDRPVD